ncbi:MAG: RNA polymerase sigma factor [Candidatus Baltobacteraceae bacterium]
MIAYAPPMREIPLLPAVGRARVAGDGSPAAASAFIPSTSTFDRIVSDYQRRLYGFALRMTGNREDAEEIVQDAFVRAFRALGKMGEEQRRDLRLQPWLYTIALNVTRNRLRSKKPPSVAIDALADPDALLRDAGDRPVQPETVVERNDEVAMVERALLSLPTHLRAAATLRFIDGRSHPEIAEILGQPIGTVKSHVHRAVRILRKILGPQLGRFVKDTDEELSDALS